MKDLEGKGFVGFGFAEGGFAYLMSRQPVKTVDELKARKVWSPEGDRIVLTAFESRRHLSRLPAHHRRPDRAADRAGGHGGLPGRGRHRLAVAHQGQVPDRSPAALYLRLAGDLGQGVREAVRRRSGTGARGPEPHLQGHRRQEPQGQCTGPCGAEEAGHRLRRAAAQRPEALAQDRGHGSAAPRAQGVLLQGRGRDGYASCSRTTAGASADRP